MDVTTSLMTFEEFERLPDGPEELELLEGELIRLPPPDWKHMEIAHQLQKMLSGALESLRRTGSAGALGEAYIEMGYRIGPDSWLRPDVSISHQDQPRSKYFEGAPALAVEIISESNTAAEMDAKVRKYLDHGAREVWLMYPKTRRVWIHGAASEAALARQGTFSSNLLPGVTLDLNQILGE